MGSGFRNFTFAETKLWFGKAAVGKASVGELHVLLTRVSVVSGFARPCH